MSVDVLWARALSSLPAPLVRSLRDAGLADASTLLNYPLMDFGEEEFRLLLGEPRETGSASVDASSTGHSSILATASGTATVPDSSFSPGQSTITTPMSATPRVGASGVTGGDPRTVHSLSVGTACGVEMQEEGGDPKTGLHVPSGGEVKTDHLDFSLQTAGVSSVNADSPHPGGLATQTAYSSTVSPVLDPVLRLSHGSEVRDAFPSWQEKTVQFDDLTGDPVRFDEFPSTAESRDGLPSSADSMDHTNLDSTPVDKSTGFTHNFPHFRKLRTTPRVGSRSSNRARQSQPIRAECSSNGSVAGGRESIERGVYSFYLWYFCSCY